MTGGPAFKGDLALQVADPKHSVCGSARLADLDFTNWWTDTSFDQHYLHVQHRTEDTVHRVKCKRAESPRLRLIDGVLHWLVPRSENQSSWFNRQ